MIDIGLVTEALEAFEWLAAVLSTLKGGSGSTEPGVGVSVDGLGALAQRVSRSPLRERLAVGVRSGDSGGVMQIWASLMAEEVEVARASAVIFRGWGQEALAQGDLEAGRGWLARSLDLFEQVAGDEAARRHLASTAFGGAIEEAGERLVGHLLAEHAEAALGAIASRRWDEAAIHWRLTTSRPDGNTHLDALVGGLLAQASALEHAGAARGIGEGDRASLRLLGLGLSLAAEAEALHVRRIEVGVKAALTLYGLGDVAAMAPVGAELAQTLSWFEGRVVGDGGLRERLAEAHVVCAAVCEHPQAAVDHLRGAVMFNPHHPTAHTLLGEALAALAARRFGQGAIEAARELAGEAVGLLEPNEALERLQSALAKAR